MAFTITDDPQWQPEHRHSARAKFLAERPMKFIAVDGEGVTADDGTHKYVLIGIGDKQISDPDGLSFERILQHLWNNKPAEHTAVVGFFLGYDFTQWLKTLPEKTAHLLLSKEGRAVRARTEGGARAPFPVQYNGWQFDILGTKRFKFRPRPNCGCTRVNPKSGEKYLVTFCEHMKGVPWMYICDAGPFFQKSFLKVIDPGQWKEPVVTDDEYATILKGKSGRGTDQLDDDMMFYNRLENDCLPRVMERLDDGFRELGIKLGTDQWYGPGQAAQAWLDKHIGPKTGNDHSRASLAELPDWKEMQEASRKSFYGGWFELFSHGYIEGTIHEYDINSAYPHSIRNLPCLLHGRYTHGVGMPDHRDGDITLVRGEFKARNPAQKRIGVMPHRDYDGKILRPKKTVGWLHWEELQASIKAGIVHPKPFIFEYAQYRRMCDCPPPLAEVADIYALRKTAGKKTPLGIACKLVPNSLYGKFAQSIGNPKYGNAIWASMITSSCRTQILNAIATHPDGINDVVMIATDGVYFRTPHPSLPISGELGDWDHEVKENMTLFKPGVYWDDAARKAIADGESPVFKARGVNARDFASHLESIDDQFKALLKRGDGPVDYKSWPMAEFPVSFAMTTATSALARGKWGTAGYVDTSMTVKQSSQPLAKRQNPVVRDGVIVSETRPWPGNNVPYTERFGMIDDSPMSEYSRDEVPVMPEGMIGMIVREGLSL